MTTSANKAIEAIQETKGNVKAAADLLEISRTQLYRIIETKPTVRDALIEARETMKDFAEQRLLDNIEQGKEASIFFYLKTQAKDRGYIERQDINVQVENELNKAIDLLEKGLKPEEYERVIGILAGTKSSATEIKVIPTSVS